MLRATGLVPSRMAECEGTASVLEGGQRGPGVRRAPAAMVGTSRFGV